LNRDRYWTFVRFFSSGVVCAFVYAFVARSMLGMGRTPIHAGFIAYLAAMPVSLMLHRWFSFRSTHPAFPEAVRFTASAMVGLAVATYAPHLLIGSSGIDEDIAIALTCVATPIVNFVLMDRWVFRTISTHHSKTRHG
jgi:putative flippase GtrA